MHNCAPIRVGLFFGGSSREREISFAAGRTIYDQLDRKFFEPLPIFVDSIGNFILLHWKYLYQSSIREIYPPAASTTRFLGIPLYIESLTTPNSDDNANFIAPIGKKIEPADFTKHFDIAFLCLHGPYGEDGTIQGLLEWYQIPYSGSAILPAALGLNKVFQRKILQNAGFLLPRSLILSQKKWLDTTHKSELFHEIITTLGLPFVVKSSTQGSSIGVSIVKDHGLSSFITAMHRAFFIEEVSYAIWKEYTLEEQKNWFNRLIDVREGIGFPLLVEGQILYTPDALLAYIELHFQKKQDAILLISAQAEEEIIIESFIQGREFSCVVLEAEKGKTITLPPTEILKGNMHFDYKAKYLPGMVRKQTPMVLPSLLLDAIRKEAAALFQLLGFQVYARIDGFLTNDNQIYLNDPNTTAGMHPSSFLFHQAAEIGLNPTQLITFIIKRSLEVRKEKGSLFAYALLQRLITMLVNT
ncbi:D-alanine--D-alanine ligase family protein [Candidatus Cardinium hertigii]|uniref:D-alanine--D-alanine ligase n=1 Tax=Candidatus Cardinium hertigii TaxID=247481 RepID=A0A3N2QD85_9BACT|nr:hypothetical protein [Candidatus Cardinium hertigii]ROT47731.1 hypothetical protein EDM02_00720 [Candidatus Cardinium hertigii]